MDGGWTARTQYASAAYCGLRHKNTGKPGTIYEHNMFSFCVGDNRDGKVQWHVSCLKVHSK